jgi:hypothetical protein
MLSIQIFQMKFVSHFKLFRLLGAEFPAKIPSTQKCFAGQCEFVNSGQSTNRDGAANSDTNSAFNRGPHQIPSNL